MKKIYYTLVLGIFTATICYAQPGAMDVTFGTTGKTQTDFAGYTDVGRAIALQTDGKIVVAGGAGGPIGAFYPVGLARYNSNGILDNTFNGNGKVSTVPSTSDHGTAYGVAIQPDGKIVATGSIGPEVYVVRYNGNGKMDSTFGANGNVKFAIGYGMDVRIAQNGKILVAIQAGDGKLNVGRLNTNGIIDSTFGVSGNASIMVGDWSEAFAMEVQSDGKIVVAGYAKIGASGKYFGLARFHASGVVDSSFGTNGGVAVNMGDDDAQAESVTIQPDGKIVAVGQSVNYSDGTNGDFALLRVNANGTADNTFGTGGIMIHDYFHEASTLYGVAIQADGKIVTAGTSGWNSFRFQIVRYKTNGTIDSTFGSNGYQSAFGGTGSGAYCVTIQPDGKIVSAGGYSTNTVDDIGIIRLLASGSVDISEADGDNNFTIYPNPAANQLTINIGGLQVEQMSIYNVDGKLVSETKQPANNSIDISHLAKGVYVAEVKMRDAVQRVRWVKM